MDEKSKSGREKMMEILDTRDFQEKVNILKQMYILDEIDDFIIDSIAASYDVVIKDGDIGNRYNELKTCIETRAKYEVNRLR